ncbi:helix-turn-helix domain-containing protein [Plantibacter sp. M259]|uniref:helix-turn-helix domain-containing protein n=1 Tax=Plantibacter sp. M259 TaxID=2583822 RepID=UPI0011103B59|nr:helix-turn-helix domain-containing protein [Plantibacter sp. M259]
MSGTMSQGADRANADKGLLDGLTAPEVIDWLQITPRYLKRLSDGGFLHTVHHNGEWYFPRWQFRDQQIRSVVPGIRLVSPSIPIAWTLDRIRKCMDDVHSSLEMDGERLSPTMWLLRGGDPVLVIAVLRERST